MPWSAQRFPSRRRRHRCRQPTQELARRVAPFQGLEAFLSAEDRVRLDGLQSIVTEKLELEVQYSLQRLLKQWVVFHVIPCMALLALLVVHIAAVLAF